MLGLLTCVENAVKDIPGVQSCTVNLAKGLAQVLYDAAMVTPRAIVQRIEESGYAARMMG